MTRLRKITSAFLICSVLGMGSAQAANMMGDLNSMFLSNNTRPQGLSTADRSGFFGGSAYIRSPIQNINLVGFDPPRFSAGCGGIDLFAGSFSFINSAQLTQVFRAVAANAVGLAFGAAIKTISPELYALMQQFQTLLQNMNNLAKNSCSLAKLIVEPAEKAATSALTDGSTGAVSKGLFSDAMGTLTGYLQSANDTLKKVGQFNPVMGNQEWKAAVATKAAGMLGAFGISDGQDASAPNSLVNRVLVSLIGYHVGSMPCEASNSAGVVSGGGDGVGKNDCSGPAILSIDDLMKGGGINSPHPEAPLKLYNCLNPNGEGNNTGGTDLQICTKISTLPWNYQGIDAYVNTYLFGTPDASSVTGDSILGRMNGSSDNFTPEQRAFLQSAGVPLVSMMHSVSQAQDRIEMTKQLRAPIVLCITSEIAYALAKSAAGIKDNNSYELSPDTKLNILAINARALQLADSCRDSNKVATIIGQIRNQTSNQAGR